MLFISPAPCSVVFGHAHCVFTAGQRSTRVDACAALTGQLAGAVLVHFALHLACVSLGAANGVWLTGGSPRAGALVRATLVDAAGVGAARVGAGVALVNILTTNEGVARVAGLAEALGWVGGGALSIQAAAELVAGALKDKGTDRN